MTTEVTEVQQETVTFYSWAGSNNPTTGAKAYPSCTAVNISGGTTKLANDGTKVRSVNKIAQFVHGTCTTADPEIIAALRKLVRTTNSGFTENREEYYEHVMTTAEREKRADTINRQQAADNEKLREENRRLTAHLEEKGRETPTRRRQEA